MSGDTAQGAGDDPEAQKLRERLMQLEEEYRLLATQGANWTPTSGQLRSHLRREQINQEMTEIRGKLGMPTTPRRPGGSIGGWLLLITATVVIIVTVSMWRP